MKRSAWVFTLR